MDIAAEHKVYEFDDFRIDVAHLMLYHRGAEIPLVPKAVETLLALIERRGKIVSKDELLEAVWPDTVVEESNLFIYLSVLRKTLGALQDGRPYVETLRRRGYRFNGDVHVVRNEVKPQHDIFDQTESKTVRQAGQIYFVKDWDRKESRETSSASSAVPALKRVEFSNNLITVGSKSLPAGVSPSTEIIDPLVEDADVAPSEPLHTAAAHRKLFKTSYVIAVSITAILVSLALLGSAYWRSRRASAANSRIRTIAILPFRPLVDENRDEALELGMADTLITRLGNNSAITVLPFESVNLKDFKGPDRDAIKAGKRLDVEAILDSSIQRSGDRILVNVSLRRVADGTTIWAETINEKFTDIFIVEDRIAAIIASSLALNLTSDERARLQKRYTSNADAYDYYIKARYNSLKINKKSLYQAIEFYEQAVKADPNYALAYAHMAEAYSTLAVAGFARYKDVEPQIQAAARKAFELDESLGEAHLQLARFDLRAWNWTSAESRFKRAIQLSPKDFQAHISYAGFLAGQGKREEAVAEARSARELSPTTPIILARESQILCKVGQLDEAERRAKNALDFDPNFWVGHLHLGFAYAAQKRYSEAITELEKARELVPESNVPVKYLAYVFAEMGNREKAFGLLDELKRANYQPTLFEQARIYNGIGEKDKALDLLERALEAHEEMPFIKIERCWDNLRSEPRFINILRRMNLDN